jgi:hypothetical protein
MPQLFGGVGSAGSVEHCPFGSGGVEFSRVGSLVVWWELLLGWSW